MMYPSYKGTVHAHYPDMKEFLSENDRNRTYIMGTNCIPKDEMLRNDGFRGVAKRGQTFIITDKVVEVYIIIYFSLLFIFLLYSIFNNNRLAHLDQLKKLLLHLPSTGKKSTQKKNLHSSQQAHNSNQHYPI